LVIRTGMPLRGQDEVESGVAFDERWSEHCAALLDDDALGAPLLLALAAGDSVNSRPQRSRSFGSAYSAVGMLAYRARAAGSAAASWPDRSVTSKGRSARRDAPCTVSRQWVAGWNVCDEGFADQLAALNRGVMGHLSQQGDIEGSRQQLPLLGRAVGEVTSLDSEGRAALLPLYDQLGH
jgi:hypothetical protein